MSNYRATKAERLEAQSNLDDRATRNLGLITLTCIQAYKWLPESYRHYYDIEDMIGDVVLHVWSHRDKFDPARGKESTWVWRAAHSKCSMIVRAAKRQRLTACSAISIDAFAAAANGKQGDNRRRVKDILPAPDMDDRRMSQNAVERVIEHASEELLDFIDALLNGRHVTSVPAYELETLAQRCGATLQDFEQVYRYAIA